MQLTNELAQEIAEKTTKITGHNVFIVNIKGIIIGAGDISRLSQYHEGSTLVINHQTRFEFTKTNSQVLAGTRPGVVLPILLNSKVIGAVGITGRPQVVGKFGELVKNQVEMMCQQSFAAELTKIRSKAEETLVHEVISGNINSMLIARGHMLGYDLNLPRVIIIIDLFDFSTFASDTWKKIKNPAESELFIQYLKGKIYTHIQAFY
ncbi:MAG: sugar diacid recognition domain-containing protein, partial [Bacillota bacterium]|nr:sugar diacid recognition domain-containing protein [Bacillota bacterium]